MRWVLRFPTPILNEPQRWLDLPWGSYDLAWPVDEFLVIPVQDRWALIGRWFDGEPVVYDGGDLEFDQRDEAITFALRAGVPVCDEHGPIASPLPDSSEMATWRQRVRLDHLSERLLDVNALIDQHPTNFHIRAWKEALIQRWHRIAHQRSASQAHR